VCEAAVSEDGNTLVVVADRGHHSHLYRFVKRGDRWHEVGLVPADPRVFQVGPLLSPNAQRLLFAQATPRNSGEMFLIDLVFTARAEAADAGELSPLHRKRLSRLCTFTQV
jgi:hypothetical protein